MKTINIILKLSVFIIFMSNYAFGQNTVWHTMQQYDDRIDVRIVTDKALKGFKPQSQYIGAEVVNKTSDALYVRVEYWAILSCQENVRAEVGATEEGVRLEPGKKASPDFWSNMHSFNIVDRMSSYCSGQESSRRKIRENEYSWIVDVGYRIISIENLSEKERENEKKEKKQKIDAFLASGDKKLHEKNYDDAIKDYENALAVDSTNQQIKERIAQAKSQKQKEENDKKATEEKKQSAEEKEKETINDDFWNETDTRESAEKSTKTIPKKNMTFGEQVAYTKKISEEKNRQEREKLDNYFESERTRMKNEIENKMNVLATSFYANQARGNAEEGIRSNSTFDRQFDNVEELQAAFQNQIYAINENAMALEEARVQQNQNWYNYNYGTETDATSAAIGTVVQGIANIVASNQAEKERQYAMDKLRKERDEQIARIENERRQKILAFRNDLLQQYPEGGVPTSRHNINLEELYFFAYIYDPNTISAKVSNVFPYAKYKDGTWAFKDKVKSEAEKVVGGNVILVGYFTTKELAEKERNVFVQFLPQAEVNVNIFEVKGKKWDGTESGSTDFWGNESQGHSEQTKDETNTTQQNTDNFWDDSSAIEKTKNNDNFWD